MKPVSQSPAPLPPDRRLASSGPSARDTKTERPLHPSVPSTPMSAPVMPPIEMRHHILTDIVTEGRVSDKSLNLLNTMSKQEKALLSIQLITDAQNALQGKDSIGAVLLQNHPGFVAHFFSEAAQTIHKLDTENIFQLSGHIQAIQATENHFAHQTPDLHRDVAKQPSVITAEDRARVATSAHGTIYVVKRVMTTSGSNNDCGLHATLGTEDRGVVHVKTSRQTLMAPVLTSIETNPDGNVANLVKLAMLDTKKADSLDRITPSAMKAYVRTVSNRPEQLQWEMAAATSEAHGQPVCLWKAGTNGDLNPVYRSPGKEKPVVHILHTGGSQGGHYSRLSLEKLGSSTSPTSSRKAHSSHSSGLPGMEETEIQELKDGEWITLKSGQKPTPGNQTRKA